MQHILPITRLEFYLHWLRELQRREETWKWDPAKTPSQEVREISDWLILVQVSFIRVSTGSGLSNTLQCTFDGKNLNLYERQKQAMEELEARRHLEAGPSTGYPQSAGVGKGKEDERHQLRKQASRIMKDSLKWVKEHAKKSDS